MIPRRYVSGGLNSLTPEVWRGLVEMMEFFQDNQQGLERIATSDNAKRKHPPAFVAQITGNRRVFAGNKTGNTPGDDECDISRVRRWEYSWDQVGIDETDDKLFADESAGGDLSSTLDSDSFHFPALNMCEAPNGTRAEPCGPGLLAGMPMPIGEWVASTYDGQADDASGTTEDIFTDVAVVMFTFRDDGGNSPEGAAVGTTGKERFVFYAMNAQGGACYVPANPLPVDMYEMLGPAS